MPLHPRAIHHPKVIRRHSSILLPSNMEATLHKRLHPLNHHSTATASRPRRHNNMDTNRVRHRSSTVTEHHPRKLLLPHNHQLILSGLGTCRR